MQPPPQRLIFPFIALMADWDLPLPSLSPLPSLASLGGDRIWGNMGRLFISKSHHLQDSLHAQVARCMHACHAVKGKGREELIDTPPSLFQSRQTAFLSAVRHVLRVYLSGDLVVCRYSQG